MSTRLAICEICQLSHEGMGKLPLGQHEKIKSMLRCIKALKARMAKTDEEKLHIEEELEGYTHAPVTDFPKKIEMMKRALEADMDILIHESSCKLCLPLKECGKRHKIALRAADLRDRALAPNEDKDGE